VQPDRAEPAVTVDRITKRFGGVTAVNDVSFTLAPGEVVALVGENGAGKSTIKNLLAGIVKADSGSIFINGAEISGDARHARHVGVATIPYVFDMLRASVLIVAVLVGTSRAGGLRALPIGRRRRLEVGP
jgi:ABC-type sugar transport system ATPase subunit